MDEPNSLSSADEEGKLMPEHEEYLGPKRMATSIKDVHIGDIVEFVYESHSRSVFVLNPIYKLHLHGLSLNHISHRMLLTEVIDSMNVEDTPQTFYNRVIVDNPSILASKSYRTYDVRKMTHITVRPYKKTQ